MILSSHALIGAATARAFTSNPILAFIIGMISHYLVDAIPHWQYRFRSLMKSRGNPEAKNIFSKKELLRDMFYLALDFGFGIFLPLYFLGTRGGEEFPFAIILGALGGMFPDALQFFHWLMPRGLLDLHQKFHDRVHTTHEFPERSISGVILQIIIVAACVFISKEIR